MRVFGFRFDPRLSGEAGLVHRWPTDDERFLTGVYSRDKTGTARLVAVFERGFAYEAACFALDLESRNLEVSVVRANLERGDFTPVLSADCKNLRGVLD